MKKVHHVTICVVTLRGIGHSLEKKFIELMKIGSYKV